MPRECNRTDRKCFEFESYAQGYLAGMENPIKRLMGKSFETFIEPKVKWLLKDLAINSLNCVKSIEDSKLLDFGCGNGEVLKCLRKMGFRGKLEGCDVSSGMLKEVVRCWNCGPLPVLHLIRDGTETSFAKSSYDVVLVCCVYHHIDSSRHHEVFNELIRILKPGGRIVFFEHNPLNPVTRLIIRSTPIDRNAVFVKAYDIRKMMSFVGLNSVRINYILFFPPRIRNRWLDGVERILWWLPFGGQYVVVGEKPL